MELPPRTEAYEYDRADKQPDDFDRGVDEYRARLHMARGLLLLIAIYVVTIVVQWLNSLDQFEGILQ